MSSLDGPQDPGPGGSAPAAPAAGAHGREIETARSFIDAVVWGEHHKVWDMLGSDGRAVVLRVATSKGMDEALAARLRDGTAAGAEREEFLRDLVNGLRADLAGIDVDHLEYELDETPSEPGRARVVALVPTPVPELLGAGLPVATIELSEDGEGWRVERIVPRTTK